PRPCFFFSSRRRHTRCLSDWSSDVCSSDLKARRVRLAILDRVPFSEEKWLEVERLAIAPPPTAEERKGLLRWQFPLEPGTEKKRSEERRVGQECRRGR